MGEAINVHQAKTHFSKLLERVAAGEEVVIAKAGEPVAKLVPYTGLAQPRVPGALAGKVTETDGCWEADEEILESEDGLLGDRGTKAAEHESPYPHA